jgi:hypothetical protein
MPLPGRLLFCILAFMPYERGTQLDLLEAYEQNHGQLLEVLGQLQAAISTHYRNDHPREPQHVGKQEEIYAMLFAVLDFAREQSA